MRPDVGSVQGEPSVRPDAWSVSVFGDVDTYTFHVTAPVSDDGDVTVRRLFAATTCAVSCDAGVSPYAVLYVTRTEYVAPGSAPPAVEPVVGAAGATRSSVTTFDCHGPSAGASISEMTSFISVV